MEEGVPQGFLTLRMKHGSPYIDLLGVALAAQGREVGSRLIRFGRSRLGQRGHDRLSVVTQGHNIQALGIYLKNGFFIKSMNIFYHIWPGELS